MIEDKYTELKTQVEAFGWTVLSIEEEHPTDDKYNDKRWYVAVRVVHNDGEEVICLPPGVAMDSMMAAGTLEMETKKLRGSS